MASDSLRRLGKESQHKKERILHPDDSLCRTRNFLSASDRSADASGSIRGRVLLH